jgi:hypothetical protein
MYVGDYDNSTCDWQVSDRALTAEAAAMAGDPKVAGYYFSDEPDPYACPSAPGQHRARSQLIHSLDLGKMTVMAMDSNSGQASLTRSPCGGVRATTWVWGSLPLLPERTVQLRLDRRDHRGGGLGRALLLGSGTGVRRLDVAPRRARSGICYVSGPTPARSGYVAFSWIWAGQGLSNQPRLLRMLTRFNKGSLAKCRRNTINGGGTLSLQGTLYFPTTNLSFAGNNSPTGTYIILVADTIKFNGGASLTNDFSSLSSGSPIKDVAFAE